MRLTVLLAILSLTILAFTNYGCERCWGTGKCKYELNLERLRQPNSLKCYPNDETDSVLLKWHPHDPEWDDYKEESGFSLYIIEGDIARTIGADPETGRISNEASANELLTSAGLQYLSKIVLWDEDIDYSTEVTCIVESGTPVQKFDETRECKRKYFDSTEKIILNSGKTYSFLVETFWDSCENFSYPSNMTSCTIK